MAVDFNSIGSGGNDNGIDGSEHKKTATNWKIDDDGRNRNELSDNGDESGDREVKEVASSKKIGTKTAIKRKEKLEYFTSSLKPQKEKATKSKRKRRGARRNDGEDPQEAHNARSGEEYGGPETIAAYNVGWNE